MGNWHVSVQTFTKRLEEQVLQNCLVQAGFAGCLVHLSSRPGHSGARPCCYNAGPQSTQHLNQTVGLRLADSGAAAYGV